VAGLEAGFASVIEAGGDGLVAVLGEAVGQLADVLGDAENLLDQHQTAAPRVRRRRAPGAEREAADAARPADVLAHQAAPLASNSWIVRLRARAASSGSESGRPALLKPWPECS